MDIREKLVELFDLAARVCNKTNCDDCRYFNEPSCTDQLAVDILIHNGVTIQKEGIWIGEGDGYADGEIVYDVWYCENCNHCIDDGMDDYELLPDFCPSCGMKKLPLPSAPKGE